VPSALCPIDDLLHDEREQIDAIDWTVVGKVKWGMVH